MTYLGARNVLHPFVRSRTTLFGTFLGALSENLGIRHTAVIVAHASHRLQKDVRAYWLAATFRLHRHFATAGADEFRSGSRT